MEKVMDFTKEELEQLADGLCPKYVRKGLEIETVIVALAKFALAEYEHYKKEYHNKHYHFGGVVPKGTQFLLGESAVVKRKIKNEE
jgi:hypothetical protein